VFSASSRLFGLKGEANSARKKHRSATIVADVKRFCQAFKSDEVFDTHRGTFSNGSGHAALNARRACSKPSA
jgi:hypothetical protein